MIPPVPSLFTLLKPYLAYCFPVLLLVFWFFFFVLRVFAVSPRRFQRAPSRNPGAINRGTEDQEGRAPPFVRDTRC